MPTSRSGPTRIYLEMGRKKVFAAALDWPGWCRAGKTEEAAVRALEEYAPRYRVVTERAGLAFPARLATDFDVVARVPGSATTDFGVIGAPAPTDAEPIRAAESRRLRSLVRAAWEVFDEVAAQSPAELRKGPRGGGRDRDKMIEHVLNAEAGYARKLGVRLAAPGLGDHAAVEELRAALIDALGTGDGGPPVERGWSPRYAARRIAWHVLDHAWEMQDRADPAGPAG